MTATLPAFLTAYRAAIVANYGAGWAADPAKLERFMLSAKATIAGLERSWLPSGASLDAAWSAIGGKGKPTLKALRALPAEG